MRRVDVAAITAVDPIGDQRRSRVVDQFAVFRRAAERRASSNTTIIGTAVSDGTPASVASQITVAATAIVETTTTMLTTSGFPFINPSFQTRNKPTISSTLQT